MITPEDATGESCCPPAFPTGVSLLTEGRAEPAAEAAGAVLAGEEAVSFPDPEEELAVDAATDPDLLAICGEAAFEDDAEALAVEAEEPGAEDLPPGAEADEATAPLRAARDSFRGPAAPRRPGVLPFLALLAGASALFAGGAYAYMSGLVSLDVDPAGMTAASHLFLAAVIITILLLYEKAARHCRNAQVAEALRIFAAGAREPVPGADPLAAAFDEAAAEVETETRARVADAEASARQEAHHATVKVKSHCERLVERYAERLHVEKKETLAALDALRAEHVHEARAWASGLEREKDARKTAEERCRALEERLATLDLEIAGRNAECAKVTGDLERLGSEVERLRTQNLKFFDKVAAQLRGSLHIALKMAEELSGTSGEHAGKKGEAMPARFVEERAGEIRVRISRTEKLIDQILDLCRIETSTLALVYSELDVLKAVKRCLGELRDEAVAKHLDLSCKSPKAMPEVITDARLFERVLRELISNAVRFTRRGGRISVMANMSSENPLGHPVKDSNVEWLRVDVSDTGEGIPAEDRQRIFTAFERGGEQFTTTDSNPGLGLTLTKHYVRLLGGDLLLESEVGRGSTFSVVLPVKVCVTTQIR